MENIPQDIVYDFLTMSQLVLEKYYVYINSNGTKTYLGKLIGKTHNIIRMCWHDGPTWEKNLIFEREMPEELKQEMLYSDRVHLVEMK